MFSGEQNRDPMKWQNEGTQLLATCHMALLHLPGWHPVWTWRAMRHSERRLTQLWSLVVLWFWLGESSMLLTGFELSLEHWQRLSGYFSLWSKMLLLFLLSPPKDQTQLSEVKLQPFSALNWGKWQLARQRVSPLHMWLWELLGIDHGVIRMWVVARFPVYLRGAQE